MFQANKLTIGFTSGKVIEKIGITKIKKRRKMKYIHAVKGSILALIIFTIIAIYIPGIGPTEEIKTILTISTFLFAILSGFLISRSNTRYDKIKELTAEEDSNWFSLYEKSKLVNKNFEEKISEAIDNYYIIAFDFDIGKAYKLQTKIVEQIYNEVKKLKNISDILMDRILLELENIERNRNKASVLAEEKITKGQWAILISLTMIMVSYMFYLKTSDVYSNIATVLFSTAVVIVLLTLRDIQNLMLGGEMIVVESGQEMFDVIGKLRYYNKKYLDEGLKVPPYLKKYRLGIHKPGEKLKIRIVDKN